MTDETRRTWRRRLLLAGLVPLVLALLLAGKVAAMTWHERGGLSSYSAEDFASAQKSFAANGRLNYFESWVSPYDQGTARYRLNDFRGAVVSLEKALETAPSDRQCQVRINLALAHDGTGDVALALRNAPGAVRHWRDGLEVLTEFGCVAPTDKDGNPNPRDQLADARAVRNALQDDLDRPLPKPEQAQDPLEDRTDRAERQRQRAEQRRQDRQDRRESGEQPTYNW